MANARTPKLRRNIVLTVVAVFLIITTVAVLRNQPSLRKFPKRLATVDDGILYRSAQPYPNHIKNLVEAHNIRTLLVVREGTSEHVQKERQTALEQGVNTVHIPVKSREPIPDEQVRDFFRCVDDPDNQPVLVHCSAGRHRTGYLCALYRIERQGWTVERAIEEMLSFGFDAEQHAVVLEQLRQHKSAPMETQTAVADDARQSGAATTP